MIAYLCPDFPGPSGGVKAIYRHVDRLNSRGVDSCVVHAGRGFRAAWFENATRVSSFGELDLRTIEAIAIPESFGADLATSVRMRVRTLLGFKRPVRFDVRGLRKVIFNQSGYYTFHRYPARARVETSPYLHPEVAGALVVSADTASYLRLAFPALKVERARPSVHEGVFQPAAQRRARVAYMPWKNRREVEQVMHILSLRGALDGFECVGIEGQSEREVARILSETAIFLTFAHPEGFNLPPLEAMACGCVVVGYDGFGGREYFSAEVGYPVPNGDVQALARTALEVLHEYRANPDRLLGLGRRAAAFVRDAYSADTEARDLVAAWSALLSKDASRGGAG